MPTIVHNEEELKALIDQPGKTVFVDFYADWCGPCRMLSPILEEIAAEHSEVVIGKVNVDECMELAAAFQISSIPLVAIFKEGHHVDGFLGLHSKADIEAML